jgi:DNA-directed RNA polymerase specialized sigma24 family protein
VIGILIRRGADFAAAEDAAQDALIEAVRVWSDDPPRDPKGWLVTVAWRKFLDANRADTSGRHRSITRVDYPDALKITDVEPLVAYVLSTSRDVLDAGRLSALRLAVAQQVERVGAYMVTKESGMFCCRVEA